MKSSKKTQSFIFEPILFSLNSSNLSGSDKRNFVDNVDELLDILLKPSQTPSSFENPVEALACVFQRPNDFVLRSYHYDDQSVQIELKPDLKALENLFVKSFEIFHQKKTNRLIKGIDKMLKKLLGEKDAKTLEFDIYKKQSESYIEDSWLNLRKMILLQLEKAFKNALNPQSEQTSKLKLQS